MQERTELERLGIELAQLVSYSEIIGGVTHNRRPIRETCDKIYDLIRDQEQKKREDEGGVETD